MQSEILHGYCIGCRLPRLIQSLESFRNGTEIANANSLASESPTQALRYQSEAIANITSERKVMEDIRDFNVYGKKCQDCKF